MKITSPRITKVLKEDSSLDETLLQTGEDLTEYSFRNQRLFEAKTENIGMQSCVFSNCLLIGCHIKKSQSSDIIFRIEFIECKLIGANFSESALNHLVFSNCKAEYLNLTMSKLKYVDFDRCDLRNSSLENCQFASVSFNASDLKEAEFYRTSLKGTDFSNCDISGIRISPIVGCELRGATVTSLQALELAHLLGVTIKG